MYRKEQIEHSPAVASVMKSFNRGVEGYSRKVGLRKQQQFISGGLEVQRPIMGGSMKRLIIIASLICVTGIHYRFTYSQGIPEEARKHFTRGIAASEMATSATDYKDAIKEFDMAKNLAPEWPDVYYNLGLLHEKTGNYEEAVLNLQMYLKLVPSSPEADQIREAIYKLEYKRDRINIRGIWKVDAKRMKGNCDPAEYMVIQGGMLSSFFAVEDIQIEIRSGSGGLEGRILSSKSRYGKLLPDGSYVPVGRDGDQVNINNMPMHTCAGEIDRKNCPWDAKFHLTQTSQDIMEGKVEIRGLAYQLDYRSGRARKGGPSGIGCNYELVLVR